MKEFFNNKRNIVISVVSLVLVVAIVVVAVTFNNNKIDVDNSTTTTQGTTENTAQGDGTTTEEVTEESSETSDKTQEEDKNSTTDTTTGKNDKETTTKKPNKPETTTRKPETTTKPSKPETTTKPGEKVTENAADLSDSELLDIWREVDCNTEAEYKAYIKNIPNYKCKWCGDHNCPSITYGPNRIGDIIVRSLDKSKCPAIKAEKVKCPQGCGRILVDSRTDKRWQTDPEHYCRGTCHLNFG